MTDASGKRPGQGVLITRPEGQRDRLATVLADAGIASRFLPLLSLRAVTEPAQVESVKTQISAISTSDLAIFISTNAVNYAGHFFESCVCEQGAGLEDTQQWPASVPCVPIGQATAKALALRGWPTVSDSVDGLAAQTTERLLATPALQNVADKKITIFRGVGGREVLAEALRSRGASVDYCELYIRGYPQYDYATVSSALGLQDNTPPAAILFASGETLANFYRHLQRYQRDGKLDARLNTQLMAIPVLVPSARVKAQAEAFGAKTVWLAANASAEGFLQALKHHCPEILS